MLDSSAKTPAWNFINLHLWFYAHSPTESPGLAQQSHGMAIVNQAPAEIWERGAVFLCGCANLLQLKSNILWHGAKKWWIQIFKCCESTDNLRLLNLFLIVNRLKQVSCPSQSLQNLKMLCTNKLKLLYITGNLKKVLLCMCSKKHDSTAGEPPAG